MARGLPREEEGDPPFLEGVETTNLLRSVFPSKMALISTLALRLEGITVGVSSPNLELAVERTPAELADTPFLELMVANNCASDTIFLEKRRWKRKGERKGGRKEEEEEENEKGTNTKRRGRRWMIRWKRR